MSTSWGRGMFVALILLLPGAAQAQDLAKPIATARFKSIDGILNDLRYVLKHSNKDAEADQLDNVPMLLNMAGIDLKKPFGGYVQMAAKAEDSPVILVLPLEDEFQFFNFLGTVQVRPGKQPDGSYSLGTLNLPIDFEFYFRIAHKHVYVTLKNRDNLDPKKLLPPETFLQGSENSVAELRVDFRPLPDAVRQYAIQNFETAIQRERDRDAGDENRIDRKLRLAVADFLSHNFKTLVNDSTELAFDVSIDRKSAEIATRLDWKAKDGSKLQQKLRALTPQASRFAGLAEKAAASLVTHWNVPDSVRPILVEAFNRAAEQSNKSKKNDIERQLDKQFFDAWRTTLEAGRLDAGLFLSGPDNQGQYAFAAGIQVKDSAKIDESLQEIEKVVPGLIKALVKYENVKVDDRPARRILTPLGKPELAELFGEKTTIHLAVNKDMIWLTGEAEGAEQLKSALSAPERKAPVLAVQLSLAHLAKLFPETERKAAHQTWQGDPQGTDRIALTIRGGDALQVDFRLQAKVLTFLANLEAIKKGN